MKLQSDLMDFDIIGLQPGSTYSITVKAKNKFGTSEPVYVSVVTLLEPTKQLAETKVKENKEEETRILAITLGVISLVILSVIMILLITFTYSRQLLELSSHATNLNNTNKRFVHYCHSPTQPNSNQVGVTRFLVCNPPHQTNF